MDVKLSVNCCILIISAAAVMMDCLTWKISNMWIYSWMTAGFIFNGIVYGADGLAKAVFGFGVPIAILGIFFYFRMIGAGDIKLLSTIGIWSGAESILMCMLWSFTAAAVMALFILIKSGAAKERLRYLKEYFKYFLGSGIKTDYKIRNAGKAKMHISIPILAGVILKIMGVYT